MPLTDVSSRESSKRFELSRTGVCRVLDEFDESENTA